MRPRSSMSRWPSVVRNATFGSVRVITALRPIVLAWLNTALPSTPRRRAPSTTGARGVAARRSATLVTVDHAVADRDDVGEGAADVDAEHQRGLRDAAPGGTFREAPSVKAPRDLDAQRRVGAERRRRLAADAIPGSPGTCGRRTSRRRESTRYSASRPSAPHSGQAPSTGRRSASRWRCAGRWKECGHRRGRARPALGAERREQHRCAERERLRADHARELEDLHDLLARRAVARSRCGCAGAGRARTCASPSSRNAV